MRKRLRLATLALVLAIAPSAASAQNTFYNKPAASALGSTDIIPLWQPGTSLGDVVKTTVGGVANYTAQNLAVACGLSNVSGTLSAGLATNGQSGASYSLVAGDCGKGLTFNNASPVSVILLAPATAGAKYVFVAVNLGAGAATLTPASGQINNGANIVLAQGAGALVWTDGTAYYAQVGGSSGGSGTVTSVAITVPAGVFSVSGSPITSSGTVTVSLVSQTANTVFAAPNGSSGTPSFRALVGADLPVPGASALGGLFSKDCSPGGQFIQKVNTDGTVSCVTPAGGGNVSGPGSSTNGFLSQWSGTSGTLLGGGLAVGTTGNNTVVETDSGGHIAPGVIPNPAATTLGGIESIGSITHLWLDSISTAGVPHASQPAFSDISGSLAGGQLPAFTGDTHTSAGSTVTTTDHVNGAAYPSGPLVNTVPVVTNAASGGTVTYEAVPNSALANSTMTLAGHSVALGGTQVFAIGDLSAIADQTIAGNGSGGSAVPVALTLGQGLKASATALNLYSPNRTAASPTIAAGDMAGQVNASSGAITIPAISSTVLAANMSVLMTAPSAAVTISTTPTVNGCPWTGIGAGGFEGLVSNGTSLDCFGFGGYGIASGDITCTSADVCTVGKIGGKAIALGTLTDGDICTYTAVGTLINCNTSPAGTGTVTSVTCNAGLSGGTFTTSGTCAIDLTHANVFSGTQTFATIGGYLANVGPTVSTACTLTSSGSAGCSSLTNGQGDCGTFIKHTANTQMVVTIPATLAIGCQVAFEDAGTFGAKGVILNGSAVTAATLHSGHAYTGTAAQYSVVGITIDANAGGSSAIAVVTGDGA